jgi:hypothetical protein
LESAKSLTARVTADANMDPTGQKSAFSAAMSASTAMAPRSGIQQPHRQASMPANETLLPLSTARLKPIQQQTKYGNVEITSSGRVILDFAGERHRIVISENGLQVFLYPLPISDATWSMETTPASHVYSLETLPAKMHKKYRYAARFVSVVRSKTPKVPSQFNAC